MKNQIRQYAPDGQMPLGRRTDNVGAVDKAVSGSRETGDVDTDSPDEHIESGPIQDSDVDESGVDRRGKNAGDLTGTDNDETGTGENIATES